MRDFITDQWRPSLERFERHQESDERRFEQVSAAVHRISTSIEVQTSTQQALLAQSERFFTNKWVKVVGIMAIAAPFIAVGIAIFPYIHK